MVNRGLIELARAKEKQFTCQSKPLADTSYWKGCVNIAPSLLHYYCPPSPPPGQGHPLTVWVVSRLSAYADHDGKPPEIFETAVSTF